MSKSTTQVLADIRHSLSLLEAINKQPGGNVKADQLKALQEENTRLKQYIETLNRSNGQYLAMYRRGRKEVLRLESDNEELSKKLLEYLKNNSNK